MKMSCSPALLATLLLLACHAAESTQEQRSTFAGAPVILISIDTLRADHLPVYGYRAVETPAIDSLAREGVVFDHAWSPCPMTLPSHVSMLTGLLPPTHGVRNNLGFRYDSAKHPAITQRLASRGYVTGAAVSSYVLRGETGLRDVFGFYDDGVDPQPRARFVDYQRAGQLSSSVADQWLDTVKGRPFFLFLHLYEPHVPYSPPEPFRSRYANAYDGEIAAADSIVGDFLKRLKDRGLYEQSLIIVTSDHGEGLGDHGEEQHSILLYTEAIRVPLIMKLPGKERAGTRIDANVSLVDLAPTIAALLGVPAEPGDGTDLLAASIPERDIYSETIYPYVQLGWSDLRSMIRGSLHYIESPRPEMYDVVKDPAEKQDVIAEHRREAARFRSAIGRFPPATAVSSAVDPETAAKLASLGYVGSVAARPDPRTLPNPVDHIGVMEEIRQAFRLVLERQHGQAIRRMQDILKRNPRLVDVRVRLAEVYQETGQLAEAEQAYKEAIAAAGPELSSDFLVGLGALYLQMNRVADAENAAGAALKGSPDKARTLQVRIAIKGGNLPRAERMAREIASTRNASPTDLLLLAEVLQAKGNHAAALEVIATAETRALTPVYDLDGLRGESLGRLERYREAIVALEREVTRFPSNLTAYSRLAILYLVSGREDQVEPTLDRMVRANPGPAARLLARQTRGSF